MDISKKIGQVFQDLQGGEVSYQLAENKILELIEDREERIYELENQNIGYGYSIGILRSTCGLDQESERCDEINSYIENLKQRLAEKGASLDSANARINSLEDECEQYMERSAKYEVKADRLQALVKQREKELEKLAIEYGKTEIRLINKEIIVKELVDVLENYAHKAGCECRVDKALTKAKQSGVVE